MFKFRHLIYLVFVWFFFQNAIAAQNKSYATMDMLNQNATLCTSKYKKCGLFVSKAYMNGSGVRNDGGAEGNNGIETAKIICAEEGALIDGGTHVWLPWLSTDTVPAKTLTNLDTSGAQYYSAGSDLLVLSIKTLTTGQVGTSLDGTDYFYWTGTKDNGLAETYTCNNWTSSTSAYGRYGARYKIRGWSSVGYDLCGLTIPVLCLQQIGPLS